METFDLPEFEILYKKNVDTRLNSFSQEVNKFVKENIKLPNSTLDVDLEEA